MNLFTQYPLFAKDPTLILLVELLIKGGAVLGFIIVLAWMLRGASAASRHIVWLGGLTSLLVLPLGIGLLPNVSINVFSQEGAPAVPVFEEPEAPVFESQSGFGMVEDWEITGMTEAAGTAGQNGYPQPSKAGLLIWLTGGLVATFPFACAFFRLRRQCRRASALDSPEWLELLDDGCAKLKLNRSIRMLEGSSGLMPMTWGIFRPVILFPSEAHSWPLSRRRAVLFHELAHIKRNDCLSQLLARLACTIHWFNPLAWQAYRQVLRTRERACDDLVLLVDKMKPSDYAGHLLALATESRSGSFLENGMIPMARKSALEGRVLAILGEPRRRLGASWRSVLATAVFSLSLALMAGTLSIASEGEQSPAEVLPKESSEDPDEDAYGYGEGRPGYGGLGGSGYSRYGAPFDPGGFGDPYGGPEPGTTRAEPASRAGTELQQAERRLAQLRLRFSDNHPQVQAVLKEIEVLREQEAQTISFTILGEVNRPGVYEMRRGSTILQALGYAEGWTQGAQMSRIYLLRGDDARALNVDRMLRGGAAPTPIEDGDVIFVTERVF